MTGKQGTLFLAGMSAAALLGSGMPAFAANQGGLAQSRIRGALTITNATPLDFGTMIRGTTAGRVIINARTGARTRTGGVVLLGAGFTRATFSATGTPNAVATFSVPSGTVVLTRASGTETMAVNTLRLSINGGPQVGINGNRTIPASGTMAFALGGRLNVGANQVAGVYNGTVNISVNYQ